MPDYMGLFELGTQPVLMFAAGGGPSAMLSLNGAAAVPSINVPAPIVGLPGYYSLQLLSTELSSAGELLVVIQSGGPDVVMILQLRQLLNEVTGRLQIFVTRQLGDNIMKHVTDSVAAATTAIKNVVVTQAQQQRK